MKVSIIVALDNKLGIGAKNRMLWHLKKDFAHFKTITMNHPIIMGRKPHESIGRALPGRTNIVITRDKNYSTPGCHVVNSLAEAIKTAKAEAGEIFIIGGALPGRTNIVITRDKNYSTPGCHVVNSLAEAIKTAKAEAGEIFIIGG